MFPFVDDWTDAASLCLALPRLGVLAIRSRVEWQGPLFAIAMRLASMPGSVIDEDLFRKYVNDPQVDAAHFKWLEDANDAAGSMLHIESWVNDRGAEYWYLMKHPDDDFSVRLRVRDEDA